MDQSVAHVLEPGVAPILRRQGQRVVGATDSYFFGNYCFAQFNELEQLDSQLVSFYFPVETVSSPYSIVPTLYHAFIRNSIEF